MRHLKQLCTACALTLVLAISAFGGQMTTGVVDPPPPPPDQSSATTQGQMTTGYTDESSTDGSVTAIDPATEVVLNLLQSLLSLF